MIVVADTSPLIALVNIEQVTVLQQLFQEIVIPPAVASELGDSRRPIPVRNFIGAPPSWLRIQEPDRMESLPNLHRGEIEAISLARQLQARLVLIDERGAAAAARGLGLNVVGTVGVLERAAENGLLNLREAFLRLRRTDFWVSERLLNERLKVCEERQRSRAARKREPGWS